MAGPQDIQRYPRGIINLLGMLGTGETPHKFSNDISGEVDMLDFYLSDRGEVVECTTAAVLALGFNAFVGSAVPSGELWLIYEASFIVPQIAAASTLDCSLVMYRSPTVNTKAVALGPRVNILASQGGCDGLHFEKPMLMQPGQSWGCRASVLTGAPAVQPILNLWLVRILI